MKGLTMPDQPLRPYCPICQKDYALDAFAAHVDYPLHGQRMSALCVEQGNLLLQIRDLLQQLVDKEATTPRVTFPPIYATCPVCRQLLFSKDDADLHAQSYHHTI